MPIPQAHEKYTVQDYMSWNDDKRWELIEGVAYDMTPAPNIKHQTILGHLAHILGNHLQGKSCALFFAPTDVVLSEHDVVQPDLLVVRDRAKITEQNIQGAPDLIIEVLSPATGKK
ncbi:MAG: Uma2 family endonuclease, partial [bacterium]